MRLQSTSIIKSPLGGDRMRLCGEVVYETPPRGPELYWFDVPSRCGDYLSESGNPWLACLLPLAVTLGEPLRICNPIDETLFENAHELMQIWKCWYPNLSVIPIEADLNHTERTETLGETASFFSGGVDAFFTVLRHNHNSKEAVHSHISDLLHVWGLDIPLRQADAYQRMLQNLRTAASHLGKDLIEIATNLRETRLEKSDWGTLYHASALASVALSLEKRYSKVLIASTFGYKNLRPWGSHPLTDRLLSTRQTRIIHDGANFDRVQKISFVIEHKVAMRFLRVCTHSGTDENCGNCHKCYRTLTTLALLGALDRCATFKNIRFDVRKIGRIYSYDESDRSALRQLQALAYQKGRRDISQAIGHSFKHSDRFDRWASIASWLSTKRYFWRWGQFLQRAIVSNSLT